ncbi:hypothetical protein BH18THE2_BH18THE2_34190 [soil metagenome]
MLLTDPPLRPCSPAILSLSTPFSHCCITTDLIDSGSLAGIILLLELSTIRIFVKCVKYIVKSSVKCVKDGVHAQQGYTTQAGMLATLLIKSC